MNNLSVCSQNRIDFLISSIKSVLHLEGDLAEVGVYKGGTAIQIAKNFPDENFYCFDTFTGIPTSVVYDNHHKVGDFFNTTFEQVVELLQDYKNTHVYKGHFPDKNYEVVSEKKFKFVHIDVDVYLSHLECMSFFYPRLVSGGIMVLDDYSTDTCLGARKAIDQFVETFSLSLRRGRETQAYIVK